MKKFKIVSNIPIPEKVSAQKGSSKYPLREMKGGQSFSIKCVNNKQKLNALNKLRGTVSRQTRMGLLKKNSKFRAIILSSEVRLWRIK